MTSRRTVRRAALTLAAALAVVPVSLVADVPAAVAATAPTPCPPAPAGVFRYAPGSGKTIALTFDDGPGRSTAQIISILQQAHVTATFFNLGIHEQEQPALVRQELAAGYPLGDHTWDHLDLTTLSAADQASEMDRERAVDSSITGMYPCFFRPPGGSYDATTLSLANARNMQVWNWSVDTEDWKADGSGDAYWVNRITSRAEAGADQAHPVVLMHNQVVGNPATVSALPAVIAFYKARGYRFVDLFGTTGPPVVSALAPAVGSPAGGTRVTVTGSNFQSVVGVRFGTLAGASIHVVSPTELLVTSPARAPGTADVVVVSRHGTSAANTHDRFTWLPPPTLTALAPASGPIQGGTRVELAGTGFSGIQAVRFGSAAGEAVHVVSPTELLVSSPPATFGPAPVVVVTDHGSSGAVTFQYVVVVAPRPAPWPTPCTGTVCPAAAS